MQIIKEKIAVKMFFCLCMLKIFATFAHKMINQESQ